MQKLRLPWKHEKIRLSIEKPTEGFEEKNVIRWVGEEGVFFFFLAA